MRSHFSAFLRILSNVNTRARIIYAAYFRNATYMQHICPIYAAYFSAYFAKFRIFSPHILHQNGPHILRKISAINRYAFVIYQQYSDGVGPSPKGGWGGAGSDPL